MQDNFQLLQRDSDICLCCFYIKNCKNKTFFFGFEAFLVFSSNPGYFKIEKYK